MKIPLQTSMEGETYWIKWDASNNHPAGFRIYRNGMVVEKAEVWNETSPVSYLIVELTRKVYNYTIELYDEFKNSIRSTVLVTIEPTPTTAPDPHPILQHHNGQLVNRHLLLLQQDFLYPLSS
ncbi:MAG: hypothetical protein ACFFFH_09065 [Candidatus Thorarchaeota archaeon]